MEKNNLAETYPGRVKEMQSAFESWKKDVYADSPWDYAGYMQRFERKGILDMEAR
jgi:hypothetical protein